ncbi:MAG TPA: N-6 DNA methylase [Candidatus Saccharimonadales bacterium]|nr:N-6 DNA methylase [Candidatus Saccharimonadales bacterium]
MGNSTYFSISEAAELLNVTPMTLRNWEKSGKLLSKRDASNRYRKYPAEKILELKSKTHETATLEVPTAKVLDARGLRFVVRQLSKAYRDSKGGSLLERFEEISKLIFTKLYAEGTHRSGGERAFSVHNGESDEATYTRINELYHKALELVPANDAKAIADLKKDPQAIATCVKILSQYDLRKVPTDIKGFIYEELIKNTFDKTENQQFFTPRTVVQFMVEIGNVAKADTIIDPACGSGGFLISSLPYLKKNARLTGLEIDPMMAWISQMNLVMNGYREGNVACLEGNGSLSHSPALADVAPENSVDLILTNPPFGSDFSDATELSKFVLGRGKKNRRRGVLFIERCLDWLKPGGRLCIVIDDGVLNGDGNTDTRNLILRKSVVEAVVSLPETAFMPYATVKASILVLSKKESKETVQGEIFMAMADNVGRKPNGDPLYSLEKNDAGEPVLVNDLPQILKAWNEYQTNQNLVQTDKVFLADLSDTDEAARLDLPFYHPMRHAARQALEMAKYKMYRLGELVTIRNTSAVPALQDPDEKWRFIGLADITSKTGKYSVEELLGSQMKSSVKLFRAGDVLFSKMRPELQKCCYISDDEEEGYTSAENIVLTIRDDNSLDLSERPEVLGEYLSLILRSELGLGQILHQITGVGRPRIGAKTLLNMQIPLPSLDEQKAIIDKHNEAWQKHLSLKEKGEKLLMESQRIVDIFYASTIDELVTR